jgi:hypothetical protein
MDVLELPSRRPSSRDAGALALNVWPIAATGYLDHGPDGHSLLVLDSLNGKWRTINSSDSIEIVDYAPSPDGTRAALLVSIPSGHAVGITSLQAWTFRVVTRLEQADGPPGAIIWDPDGNIYLSMWRPADDAPSLWRVTESGGRPVRIAAMPSTCVMVSLTLSARARIGACVGSDRRSDIWVVEGIGR